MYYVKYEYLICCFCLKMMSIKASIGGGQDSVGSSSCPYKSMIPNWFPTSLLVLGLVKQDQNTLKRCLFRFKFVELLLVKRNSVHSSCLMFQSVDAFFCVCAFILKLLLQVVPQDFPYLELLFLSD
jgi:hypothetical protein